MQYNIETLESVFAAAESGWYYAGKVVGIVAKIAVVVFLATL